MDQLETLIGLENDINLLEKKKVELEKLLLNELGENLQKQIDKYNKNILDLKEIKSHTELIIIDMEVDLLDYEETVKKLDKKLYSGDISDLKELEYLSEEKASCKNNLDLLEDNLLELFEKMELLESDISIGLGELKQAENEYNKCMKDNEEYIHKTRKNIENININISKYEDCVEIELLSKYKSIKKIKKYGIVAVENGICKGCNIKLSSGILDEVKQVSNITFCENCGRIIYHSKIRN